MKPLQPVAPGTKILLGVSFFVLFFAVWAAVTFGGVVPKVFLADPITMVRSGYDLLVNQGFIKDIGMTVWRVFGGFLLAAVLAIPLGVLMGAYKPIEAFFEPFVSFARYLPASAFIPLLILWAGIGEAQKLSVIFIGSFFQLVLMMAVSVGNTRRDLVEAAYTLGASDKGIVLRVLVPSSAPEIFETLRMVLGWAWTYVIVAELIGASSGIGHMITDSQALLAVGDHVANAAGRAYQFRHDHIRPGPAQHHPQGFKNLRCAAGHQHAQHNAFVRGAQRVGCLDQIAPGVTHADRHHQHQLKKRADENHGQLLGLANARPKYQQRNKR